MHLDNESKVKEFGKKLAQCSSDISDSIVIYLEGDLGKFRAGPELGQSSW